MNSRYIKLVLKENDPFSYEDKIEGVFYEYRKIGKFGDVAISITGGYLNLQEILDVSPGTFMRFTKHDTKVDHYHLIMIEDPTEDDCPLYTDVLSI